MRITKLLALALAMSLVGSGLTGAALAASDDTQSPIDKILDEADENSDSAIGFGWEAAKSFYDASMGKAAGTYNRYVGNDADTGKTLAAERDENIEAIETYANRSTTLDYLSRPLVATDDISSYDVAEVEMRRGTESETFFVEVNHIENGTLTGVTATTTTSKPVDHTCTLDDAAATQLDEEVENLYEKYPAQNKSVYEAPGELSRIESQYKGDLNCTFLGGDSP